jgi:hypothetical protein
MKVAPSLRRLTVVAWIVIVIVLALLIVIAYLRHLHRAHINEGSRPPPAPAHRDTAHRSLHIAVVEPYGKKGPFSR